MSLLHSLRQWHSNSVRYSNSLGPSSLTRSYSVAIVEECSYSGCSALLRSLEGETLEDYSKRAYKVCRTNGIIHLDPTSAPWRASSQPCRFGSATSFLGVSAAAVSTIRVIKRESQDIQEGEVSFREDSQHSGMFNSGIDTISLVDNAAGYCPIRNDYLPVVDDVSASEKALPNPVLTASRPPSEKTRPHLEPPRAGRALASASSNTSSRKELNVPQLDLSGNSLPPPPHVLKTSVCWNDYGPLRSTSGASCNGKDEGKRFGGVTGNSDLVAGEKVSDDEIVLSPRESCSPHSNKLERGRLAWSPIGETGRGGDDDPLTVKPTTQQGNNRDDSSPVNSKKDGCSAREHHKSRSIGGYVIAERGDDKRKVEKATDRFTRPTTPPRMIHSTQMAIKPGMASPLGDDNAFVWFGEPDSPACHQSTENVEVKVAADAKGRGQTCILQHQRNKAKLILEMHVRRQRSMIECALRARERSWRIRRYKLGAEVLLKFYALRRNAESKHLSQEHQPLPNAGQQGDGQAKRETVSEITALLRGAKSPETVPIRVEAKAVPGMKDTTAWAEAGRPGDEPERHTGAGEPFVRREDHEGIAVARVSAPLPVSFEVMADGITGLGAGGGGKHEQARRQKRLEALRARKEAEAKVH